VDQLKRVVILIAVSIAAFAASAGLASAGNRPAKLQLRETDKGKILVNRAGFTLYAFSKDKRGTDMCAAIKIPVDCLMVWPALVTKGRPMIGSGVKRSLVGTIMIPHVGRQVTYAGHPLYMYVGDGAPGETSYVGAFQFGGRWSAVTAGGRLVK
jgi:predicted lipoprotein with Yx(FWY)xxD motif